MTGNLLTSTEVDPRIEPDPRRVRLKLADAGEGLNGGEKAPVGTYSCIFIICSTKDGESRCSEPSS